MVDQGEVSKAVIAGANARNQVVIPFVGGPRFAMATEAGDSPGVMAWIGALCGSGGAQLVLHRAVVIPVATAALIAATVFGRFRKLRAAGRFEPTAITVVLDDEGITYSTPAKTTALPWNIWYRAYRRFGIWHIKLAAAPQQGIAIPDSSLEPEQRDRLRGLLAERGLLRTPWR